MPLRHKSQASDVRNITALRKSTKTELGGFYDIVGKLKDYCDSERLRSASIGTTVKATVSLFFSWLPELMVDLHFSAVSQPRQSA